MSNKKLKTQYQKHQYFYSLLPSPPPPEKILSPLSSLWPLSDSL